MLNVYVQRENKLSIPIIHTKGRGGGTFANFLYPLTCRNVLREINFLRIYIKKNLLKFLPKN